MKLDTVKLEEFRKTLPKDIQQEVFNWLITRYSVATALFLIQQEGIKQGDVVVKDWCQALGMAGEDKSNEEGLHFNLFNGVSDKDAVKENINPDYPIIIVQHTFKNGRKKDFSTLVIDGNKRLRKAFLQGRERVNAYYLPEKLAKLCIV